MNYFILMNVGIANIIYLIIGFSGAMFLVAGFKLLIQNSYILRKEMHPDKEEPVVIRGLSKFINSIFGHILVAILVIVITVFIIADVWNYNEGSQKPDDTLSESIEEFRNDDLIYEGQKTYEYDGRIEYEYVLSGDDRDYPYLMAEAFNSCDEIDKNRKIVINALGYIDHGALGCVFALDNYTYGDVKIYDHIVRISIGDTELLGYPIMKDLSSFLTIDGIIEYNGSCDALVNTLDSGEDILSYWPELAFVKILGSGRGPSAELTEDTAVIHGHTNMTNVEIPDADEVTLIGSKGTVTYTSGEFTYELGGDSAFTFTVKQNGIMDLLSEVGEFYAVRVTDTEGEVYELGYIPSDSGY